MLRDMFVVVVDLCLLLFVTSDAFIYQDGVVLPESPFLVLNSPIVLNCTLTGYRGPEKSDKLFFLHQNKRVADHYVKILTKHTLQLRIPFSHESDDGRYTCVLRKKDGSDQFIGHQIVTIDFKLESAPSIDCRVHNWERMVCKWTLPTNYHHPENVNVTLVWAVNNGEQKDCPQQTRENCTWTLSDRQRSFIRDKLYYMVIIVNNVRNGKEAKSQNFRVDTSSLVKPAPIANTSIKTTSINSSCVVLKWKQRSVNAKDEEKLYRLQFSSDWHSSSDNINGLTKPEYMMCSLTPYTKYTVTIACRPRNGGFWSDDVTITIRTAEDVPKYSPELSPGNYVQISQTDRVRKVVFFWKPIDSQYTNGQIKLYRLTYQDLTTHITEEEDVLNPHATSAVLNLRPDVAYKIGLTAWTGVGSSQHPSYIYVPSAKDKPPFPQKFSVKATIRDGKTDIKLSWLPPPDDSNSRTKRLASDEERDSLALDGQTVGQTVGETDLMVRRKRQANQLIHYTVYWCVGSWQHQACQFEINWKNVLSTLTSYSIQKPGTDYDHFMYGISADQETVSSGVLWSRCTYIKDKVPEFGPKDFRLAENNPDNSISVLWSEYTCKESGYIEYYLLYYCRSNGNNCSGPEHTQRVDGEAYNYTVTDLESEVSYILWILAVTEGGNSPVSNIVIYTVLSPQGFSTGHMIGIIVAGVLAGIVVILLCFCLICLVIRRRHRKGMNTSKLELSEPPPLPNIQFNVHSVPLKVPCKYDSLPPSPTSQTFFLSDREITPMSTAERGPKRADVMPMNDLNTERTRTRQLKPSPRNVGIDGYSTIDSNNMDTLPSQYSVRNHNNGVSTFVIGDTQVYSPKSRLYTRGEDSGIVDQSEQESCGGIDILENSTTKLLPSTDDEAPHSLEKSPRLVTSSRNHSRDNLHNNQPVTNSRQNSRDNIRQNSRDNLRQYSRENSRQNSRDNLKNSRDNSLDNIHDDRELRDSSCNVSRSGSRDSFSSGKPSRSSTPKLRHFANRPLPQLPSAPPPPVSPYQTTDIIDRINQSSEDELGLHHEYHIIESDPDLTGGKRSYPGTGMTRNDSRSRALDFSTYVIDPNKYSSSTLQPSSKRKSPSLGIHARMAKTDDENHGELRPLRVSQSLEDQLDNPNAHEFDHINNRDNRNNFAMDNQDNSQHNNQDYNRENYPPDYPHMNENFNHTFDRDSPPRGSLDHRDSNENHHPVHHPDHHPIDHHQDLYPDHQKHQQPPVSDYMFHLPLQYYEDPISRDDLPSTEL